MALVNLRDMLYHAYEHGYAVGAFELVSLEFLEGVMDAAERCRAPVIVGLAESHSEYFDFELLMPAVEAAAWRATVPVAIHLAHGSSLESAVRAIKLGCNAVTVKASHEPFPEDINRARRVVEMAHGCGVPVEGELGDVPGAEGEDAEHHPGGMAYTTVAEAKTYVDRAGVDFLAVSIGTVHGRLKAKPKLDYQRLKQINAALGIPLVIHGGTGLGDDQFRRLIANGVAKINCFAALADAGGARMRDNCKEEGPSHGYTRLMRNVSSAISAEAERWMRLWGSATRATEVLARCRPWSPVEHLIVYNVADIAEHEVQTMMAEGRKVLGAIPGVRNVITGKAVKDDVQYRYVWLVRFAHPAVIESYREHPEHVAFADNLFRPVAGDRVSVDYQVVESGPAEGTSRGTSSGRDVSL